MGREIHETLEIKSENSFSQKTQYVSNLGKNR